MNSAIFALLASSLVPVSASQPLTAAQRSVISAVLTYEVTITGFPSHRPALFLDQTEEWLPADSDPAAYDDAPAQVRDQLREEWSIRLPPGLRADNCPTSLRPYEPPLPFLLYPAAIFEEDVANEEATEALDPLFSFFPFASSVSRLVPPLGK